MLGAVAASSAQGGLLHRWPGDQVTGLRKQVSGYHQPSGDVSISWVRVERSLAPPQPSSQLQGPERPWEWQSIILVILAAAAVSNDICKRGA